MATITLVGCDETPPEYRNRIGQSINIPADMMRPDVGYRGQFLGCPGVLIDPEHWEIRPVDMRTDEEKWLDEADALLAQEPVAGEPIGEITRRAIRAQWLILRAQSRITRRQGM